ncbi:tetratricopeptide repeat protein [Streptomyces scabiei]|uniref:tetratricopeptide repeat protein n=1 Tax=Streptomyces scabiei TaxID=1930 RepID=UPI00131B9468|nr:tetratricopeptide repeat protein [Streptomyces scabiei]
MNEPETPANAVIKVDLRRLGEWKREKLRDTPSGRSLARNLQVSPTTVSEWLRGKRVPQSCRVLLALISFIRVEAHRRSLLDTAVGDRDGETVAQLLDKERWRVLYEKDSLQRSQLGSAAAEGWQARASLEEQTRGTPRSVERFHPVRTWTARQLGVHAAISGELALTPDKDFVLPMFVPRPHDTALRELLSAAAEHGESKLVLVRGDSCTGKTRSAFEAVREVVPDWDLARFGKVESLLAALQLAEIRPRTVIWLDTGHHFLYGAIGETVAAALRNLLDQGDGPVLILLTLWREDDHVLTSAPLPGQEDTHLHARTLLAQADRINVPPDFGDEMNAVRETSTSDISLAQALRVGTSAITQNLAAGPALLDHYENPAGGQGVHGRALITAAIDARRLGVNGPLPLEFLRAAAPGYLTDSQRAEADPESWFTAALAYAQTRIKRVVSALHSLPSAAGMGPAPGVVGLADYLEQHERSVRRLICPPATFWTAALDHLATPDVRRLGRAAAARGRFRHAASLYYSVADHGDTTVLGLLGQIREAVGETADAERLYKRAADDGYAVAMIRLALLRERAGDGGSAEPLYARAARAGNTGAIMRLARLREKQGDLADAERLYTQAAAAENTRAMIRLARIREKQKDANGAEKWYRRTIAASGEGELLRMAQKWERGGDWTNAERLYSLAAECGAAYASVLWARLRSRRGDSVGAERLYRQAADAGNTGAMVHLAQMCEKVEDWTTAEHLYRQAADGENVGALLHLARLKGKNGDRAGSEALCRKAADNGEPQGLILLARACDKRGDRAGAESLYKEAAERGGATALFRMARLRNRDGDDASAALLYQQAADTGNTVALVRLGRLTEKAGDPTRAEHMFRQACDGGDSNAVAELMRVRMSSDQPLTYGLEPDGNPSPPW